MLDGGPRDWLVPRLDGRLRLQKPPLAYWLAAGSFLVFGVHEWSGRLLFAAATWLTAGLVYRFGRDAYGRRAGLVAGAVVLGSAMIARFGRLAETDVLVTFFVTAAVYANWRAVEGPSLRRPLSHLKRGADSRFGAAAWFHLGALATSLAILSKGPPALFPVLFIVIWAFVRRRYGALWYWLLCGAPLTIVAIAAPWFVYITASAEYKTLLNELRMVAAGGGHRGTFLNYFAYLPLAFLPWTGLTVLSIWVAVRRCRRDPRLAAPLTWAAVVLVPLCLAGQKQPHYLLPIVPPLALLTGWYVDRASRFRRTGGSHRLVTGVLTVTLIGCIAAGVAVPALGWFDRGRLAPWDAGMCALVVATTVAVLLVVRRRGPSAGVLPWCAATVLTLPVLTGVWLPTLDESSPKTIANEIRRTFGDRPVCRFGPGNLPLEFSLRRFVPSVPTTERLARVIAADPRTVVVASEDPVGLNTHGLPGLVPRLTFRDDEKLIRVYEVGPQPSVAE